MLFSHEKLDVYRVSMEYVGWAYRLSKSLLAKERHVRDQLLRASQSIPQNIAEGNGKGTFPDRRRFFEIARGSALECASIQDILQECEIIDSRQNNDGKKMLCRIVAMLTKLCKRGQFVQEEVVHYGNVGDGVCDYDYDNDHDHDHEHDHEKDYEKDHENI